MRNVQEGTGYVRGVEKIDQCDMETLGVLDSGEQTIDAPEERWSPQAAKQEGDMIKAKKKSMYQGHVLKNVMSAGMLEMFLLILGVGVIFRLGRYALSTV